MIIGRSVLGRPIVAYELGDPRSTFKAVILGSMHGFRERAGETVTRAIRSGPAVRGVDLWVIDTINPDGDALRQRGNAHGVDLNRNWPNNWAPIAGSGDRFDTHYSGPRPLSEPETRAMYTFLQRIRPARMVSLHQPLFAVDTTDGGRRDPRFRTALASALGLPAEPLVCLAVCHGSMTGWLTNYQTGAAITVEFGTAPSAPYLKQVAHRIVAAVMTGHRIPPPVPTDPRIHNPRGHLDRVSRTARGILVSGWAFDPDAPGGNIRMRYEDTNPQGHRVVVGRALLARPDVARIFRLPGRHGFATVLPMTATGVHTVCATAWNTGRGTGDTRLGCVTITVPGPAGALDAVHLSAARLSIGGWAADPLAPKRRGLVHIYLTGPLGPHGTTRKTGRSLTTNGNRPDVARHLRWTGPKQGFQLTLGLPGRGQYRLCAYSIGLRIAGARKLLGCVAIRR